MCRLIYTTYDICLHTEMRMWICECYSRPESSDRSYPSCAQPVYFHDGPGICNGCHGFDNWMMQKRSWDDAVTRAIGQQVRREGEMKVMEAWREIKKKRCEERADEEAKRLWRMYGQRNLRERKKERQRQKEMRKWTKDAGMETEMETEREDGEISSDEDGETSDVKEIEKRKPTF